MPDDEDGGAGQRRRRDWRRAPREAELVVGLRESREPRHHDVPDSDGLQVVVSVRPTGSLGLVAKGTRSVSVFLVNHRVPGRRFGWHLN